MRQPPHLATDGKVAYLHIGTHKTGTTSFQRWALAHEAELSQTTGLAYYRGLFDANHWEIPMLCLRANRNMPRRVWTADWCLDEWREPVEAHIREQAAREDPALLISAEALSLIRHPDEVERLAELLAPRSLEVLAVLREPAAFLRSYRETMRTTGFAPSPLRESFAYTEPDTWLLDYEGLLSAYRDALGAERVSTVSYEEAMTAHGSVIPAILEKWGFEHSSLPSWEGVFERVTTARSRRTLPARVRAAARRLRARR